MSNAKKTMDLQKLVEHPSSLKLLILHTPFPLEISTLWRCTNLIKLDLSKNNLQTFPYIGNLANLKFMFLHQNKLDHEILRGIFYSERQPSYSPLANSIVWVTFQGNKNKFFARHFLINETSVLAVDNHMIIPEERKQSVLESRIQPFSQQTDISYILENKQSLSKTATEEEYMEQFWQEMRELRKKVQVICPIIKLQKLYRSWIVRKRIKDKKQECAQIQKLKSTAFKGWTQLYMRQKKLFLFLRRRNKQHYLLPLRDMKLQTIKQKMLEWAGRAKQRVLLRKLSLKKQVQFYQILRSNMLMFKSLYTVLDIDKSEFLLIEVEIFKEIQQTVKKFIASLNGNDTFEVTDNTKYLFRQICEGNIKKQYPRLLSINQRSYVIRLNYEKKNTLNPPKSLLNQNICAIPTYKTSLKPLFKNQNKHHFSAADKNQIKKHITQLEKRQKIVSEEYVRIKGSKRVLKDLVRCVFYLNSQVIQVDESHYISQSRKIQLFSQRSANKLASVTLIQKFWRGYIFRKRQKSNAQLCAKQYRAVVKIQRWIKALPQRKKYLFQNQILPLLKQINDPYFILKMDDYLKLIQNVEDPLTNYLNRMKILQQNLVPYLNPDTKKITLFWNPNQEASPGFKQKVNICYEKKRIPFNTVFIKSVFKCQNPRHFFTWPNSSDPNPNSVLERGDFSHLFHFNTLTSLAQKDNAYWMKISCNSVQEAKVRVLGISLKNYSFRDSFKFKIYGHEIVDFKKCLKKHILSNQSIFITKGDVVLKQDNSKIQKFNFKSRIYLKNDENQKPIKIQQNLIIFAQNFPSENQSPLELQSSISEGSLQAPEKQKKMRKKATLYVDQMQFEDLNSIEVPSTIQMEARNITISQELLMSQRKILKEDLLPFALKKMLPLKKEIKSYKFEKKLKKREPSFILDNASSKQERIMTEPDLPIKRQAREQKSQKSQLEYSTVKQKIKRNYIYRKDLMKGNKEDFSFHQNFVNLNNFLQQQGILQQRRRIKTELEISAYQSADNIRVSLDKAADEMARRKQNKMKKVENDIKAHKDTLEKHRQQKEQMKDEQQRMQSVSKQKRVKNRHQVRRLKVSFAEECFPIINRSHNSLRSQSESIQKPAHQSAESRKFQIPGVK